MNGGPGSTDFDRLVERRGTDSLKWKHVEGHDALPLWVADMDFPSPPEVIEALRARVDHGVFGYAVPSRALTDAVCRWLQNRYGWTIEPGWIVWLPGLVSGLNVVCRAFAEPGDAVLTVTPIYPPFLAAPAHFDQTSVACPMTRDKDGWHIDFDRLRAALTHRTKILLFCSPHNPTGRVWSRAELEQVADFCLKYDLVLCSDEIHCDLPLRPGLSHTPTASLHAEILSRTVTLMSPAKTFNLAGLNCGFAVIADPQRRRSFIRAMRGIVPHVNCFGYAAAQAAYEHGGPWLERLLAYLRINHDLVLETVNSLPGLSMLAAEATYLAWIDGRGLGLEDPIGFFRRAGVALSDGRDFAAPGYVRLNFGCPRPLLTEALARLRTAVNDL